MFKKIKKAYYNAGAAFTAGMILSAGDAHATQSFNTITTNIQKSISDVPGMITGVAYLVGILLAVLGLMKIKDHTENPTQTPLKDGMIRLLIGGGLLAVPIILEAMRDTVGDTTAIEGHTLKKINFTVN